jgi:hypothetical protein
MSAAWETSRTCLSAATNHTKELIAKHISCHNPIHFAISCKLYRFAFHQEVRPDGGAASRKPERLAEKLLAVRLCLGLSQNGVIGRIGFDDDLSQAEVSMFERGIRVPPLPVILEYARAANIYVEVLIDDSLDLPTKIPSREKHAGIRRKLTSKRS